MERFFRLGYTVGMGEEDTIATLIRRQRRAAGLTQDELGEAIDYTGRRISEWESGRAPPSRDAINAMSRFFRISADEFLRRLPRDPALDAILAEEEERKRGHGPERVRANHILEDLIDHPDLWDKWMSYGEYLLTQRP